MPATTEKDKEVESQHETLPLDQFFARLKLGYFHWRLLTLCGLGFSAAATEVVLTSFLMPELRRYWDLNEYQLGLLPTLGSLASNFGEILFGIAADHVGRRPVFVLTSVLVAIFGVLSAFSPDIRWLYAFRTVVGFSFGGNIAVDFALFSEFIPTRKRGVLLFAMAAFWPLGQLLTCLIAWWTIPWVGWRGFCVAAAIPSVLAACFRPLLPESPRWLLLQGQVAEATEVCRHMAEISGCVLAEVGLAPGVQVVLEEEASPLVPKEKAAGPCGEHSALHLFGPTLRRTTLAIIFFACGLEIGGYALTTLLPSYLESRGMHAHDIYTTMTLNSAMEIVGIVTAAYVATKIGRLLPMRVSTVLITVGVIGSALVHGNGTIMLWTTMAAAFLEGGWSLFHVYTPEAFPTELRASGVGVVSAAASLSAALLPMGCAWLLVHLRTDQVVFALGVLVLLTGCAASLLLHVETKDRDLQDHRLASKHDH